MQCHQLHTSCIQVQYVPITLFSTNESSTVTNESITVSTTTVFVTKSGTLTTNSGNAMEIDIVIETVMNLLEWEIGNRYTLLLL